MDTARKNTIEISSTALRSWWVWYDRLLEEWFYTDTPPRQDLALHEQLEKEKTTIYQVQADTGVAAIEAVCPGYRDDRRHRHDHVWVPVKPATPRVH